MMPIEKKADKVLVDLYRRFPACFSEDTPKPLKIGIQYDLIAMQCRLGRPYTKSSIKAALQQYVLRMPYLKTLKTGAKRVDLSGSEVGEVSLAESKEAKVRRKKLTDTPYPPKRKARVKVKNKVDVSVKAEQNIEEKTENTRHLNPISETENKPKVILKKRRIIIKKTTHE